MQALTRDTQVPVIIARNTRDEISPFLDGHIEAFEKENAVSQKSMTYTASWGRTQMWRDDKILTKATDHNTQWAKVGKPTKSISGNYFWSHL